MQSKFKSISKTQIPNLYKLGFAALASGSLATLFLALQTSQAIAQVTIQSTGAISGTLNFPFGPTTNGRTTRIDTDSNGTYFRNLGTKNNPNLVPVYNSKFVQVATNKDGSLRYFVDFLGLQFISSDGVIASPVLSGGGLTTYKYQNRPNPQFQVKFQAAVQDEFALQKAFYTGVVTDPKTGIQYQGTFEVNGQGPRYSDRNGGDSPTVFDFKTDYKPGGIKPQPALNSYKMTNVPLVRLTINVPANAQIVTPGGGTTTGGGTTPSTPSTPPTSSIPSTPPTSSIPSTPPTSFIPSTPPTSSIPSTPTTPISSNPSAPAPQPSVEFSSGRVLAVNPDSIIGSSGNSQDGKQIASSTNISNVEQIACSQNTVNCRPKPNQSKKVGPRSRVLVR